MLSRFAAAHPEITEIELDPLLLTPAEAVALDARIVVAGPAAEVQPAARFLGRHHHPSSRSVQAPAAFVRG